jgi:hypothetical protein
MPNHHDSYEKVRLAMEKLCGPDPLSERLQDALGVLVPLQVDDCPTEELKRLFTEVTWALTREQMPMTLDGQRRIAAKIIDLFESVCRLRAA